MSDSVDPDETAHICIYAVYKSLFLSPVAVKELMHTFCSASFACIRYKNAKTIQEDYLNSSCDQIINATLKAVTFHVSQ